ncbi:ABC transporter permease [Pseudonocardia kunmingensis]|uniref:Peptide/nickel transport system permease protein n=1 Tax=Pseudonocardia kunmingensis TaxID=630975 RepID=A0A543CXC0_9PSEU|nr:ABC transporter permease [Pseudonocardia kunmingensis]TQM01757.1 peptide/nickel transport system permease protein [Pseudonocardia kunmingensis]
MAAHESATLAGKPTDPAPPGGGDPEPAVGHGRGRLAAGGLPRFVLRRLLLFVPTAVGAGLLTFLLVKIIPGGPAYAKLGEEATPEAIAVVERQLGLDRPLPEQFFGWLGSALLGDLGMSFQTGQPVINLIVNALPVTIELVVLAILGTIAVAVPIGVYAARRADRPVGRWIRSTSGLGLAVPDFFLALVLISIFSVGLGLLPRLGYPRLTEDPVGNLYHVILPVLPMILGGSAIVIRQVGAAMVDALASDYCRTARAMGLPERVITWQYAFRAALPTVLNVVALLALGQLGVTLVLEKIFVLPGMGSALINGIGVRDYPLILGIVLVYVAIALVVNLVVDIMAGIVDPASRGA